jgi:hypothetical protein
MKYRRQSHRISIGEKYLYGAHKGSQSLREMMTAESISWESEDRVKNYDSDLEKEWTACGYPLMGRQLWFGKPGKEAGRKKDPREDDMRPNVWKEGVPPKEDAAVFDKPLSFKELVSPMADLMQALDVDERMEVFSLIAGIRRPHTDLFHRVDDSGAYFCPDVEILARILNLQERAQEKAAILSHGSLIEYLLLLEGIARNEDVKYRDHSSYLKNKNVGRGNNVATMMRAIKLRLGIQDEAVEQGRDITKPVEDLWDIFSVNMPIRGISNEELRELTGN